MSKVCTSLREAKRNATALRLQQCAITLTLNQGYDGWTMDDLAQAADVSRRTVFNYYENKAETVLGPPVQLDPHRIAAFVAGGPTGNLLDDTLELAADVIAEGSDERSYVSEGRNAILSDPHLIRLVHERFEAISTEFAEHVRAREGADHSARRARLLSRLIILLFDQAAVQAEADPDRPFAEHFAEAIADARSIAG